MGKLVDQLKAIPWESWGEPTPEGQRDFHVLENPMESEFDYHFSADYHDHHLIAEVIDKGLRPLLTWEDFELYITDEGVPPGKVATKWGWGYLLNPDVREDGKTEQVFLHMPVSTAQPTLRLIWSAGQTSPGNNIVFGVEKWELPSMAELGDLEAGQVILQSAPAPQTPWQLVVTDIDLGEATLGNMLFLRIFRDAGSVDDRYPAPVALLFARLI